MRLRYLCGYHIEDNFAIEFYFAIDPFAKILFIMVTFDTRSVVWCIPCVPYNKFSYIFHYPFRVVDTSCGYLTSNSFCTPASDNHNWVNTIKSGYIWHIHLVLTIKCELVLISCMQGGRSYTKQLFCNWNMIVCWASLLNCLLLAYTSIPTHIICGNNGQLVCDYLMELNTLALYSLRIVLLKWKCIDGKVPKKFVHIAGKAVKLITPYMGRHYWFIQLGKGPSTCLSVGPYKSDVQILSSDISRV